MGQDQRCPNRARKQPRRCAATLSHRALCVNPTTAEGWYKTFALPATRNAQQIAAGLRTFYV